METGEAAAPLQAPDRYFGTYRPRSLRRPGLSGCMETKNSDTTTADSPSEPRGTQALSCRPMQLGSITRDLCDDDIAEVLLTMPIEDARRVKLCQEHILISRRSWARIQTSIGLLIAQNSKLASHGLNVVKMSIEQASAFANTMETVCASHSAGVRLEGLSSKDARLFRLVASKFAEENPEASRITGVEMSQDRLHVFVLCGDQRYEVTNIVGECAADQLRAEIELREGGGNAG